MSQFKDSLEKSAIPDISELDRIGQGEGASKIINPFWYLEESDSENSPLKVYPHESCDPQPSARAKPANVTYEGSTFPRPQSRVSDMSQQSNESYNPKQVIFGVLPSHGTMDSSYSFANESRGAGVTYDYVRSPVSQVQSQKSDQSSERPSPKHVTFNIPDEDDSIDEAASLSKGVDRTFDVTRPPVPQQQRENISDAGDVKYGTFSEHVSQTRPIDRTFDTGATHRAQQDQSSSAPHQATDDVSAKGGTFDATKSSKSVDSSYSPADQTKSVHAPFAMGTSSHPLYQSSIDPGRSRDMESADSSWIELEQSIYKMMKSNLNSIYEEFTPELQLQYLRICFEDMFPKAVKFEHFASSVKYLLYEHLPNFSLQKQYSPGCLLSNLRHCLNRYRQSFEKLEMNLIQLNNQLTAKLEADAGRLEDQKKSVKELVLGYQERLRCANERAKNARHQTASLQAQLCEAVERVQQLEDRYLTSSDTRSLLQERLMSLSKQRSQTSKSRSGIRTIDELEYMSEMEEIIASGDALCSSLQSRLAEEHASNERLRVALKENLGAIAFLQSELSSTTEESSHKSALLRALTEDVVDSFETSLAAYLSSTPVDDPSAEPGAKLTAWKQQLESSIREKEEEIHTLDKALVDRELKLADMRNRLRRKREKIGDLEQDCSTLSSSLTQKQLQVDSKEMEINSLNNNLTEMQSAIDGMQQELVQKESILVELKEEVTKKQKEIKTLEDLRAKFSANVSGIGFELPKSMQSFVSSICSSKPFYVPTVNGDESRCCTKFDTSLPSTSTPIKSETCSHYRLKRKNGDKRHEFKKTITVKSPNRNDPLHLNVSLLPTESGEHLQCDILVREGQSVQGKGLGPVEGQKRTLSSKTVETSSRNIESSVSPYSYLPSKSLAYSTPGASIGVRPTAFGNGYQAGQPMRRALFPESSEIISSDLIPNLFPSPSYQEYSQQMSQAQRNVLESLRIQPRKLFADSNVASTSDTNQPSGVVGDVSPKDLSGMHERRPIYSPQNSVGFSVRHNFSSAYTDTDESSTSEQPSISRRTTI